MSDIGLFAAFVIGLAGGVHCFGMCGGITLALQSAVPAGKHSYAYTLAYHFGRIFSYAAAGALAGAIGSIATHASPFGFSVLSALSAVLLILLGCYIGQWYMGLSRLEQLGGVVWRQFQPLAKRFVPFKTPLHSIAYGAVWGFLPCGLVYSTLSWALTTGSWSRGALVMLAFGAGTLPAMLAVSFGAKSASVVFRHHITRQLIAVLLVSFGLYLIFTLFKNIN
ncbi:sulfite exporter TauE/SafE family protein [Alteromonas sp. ASW11-36]|uniref:Sulfite exporter TauE/SafE family protein n=1 Tax=Alteromonas arenosi TaxID=3055817 RepID=A0ABT7SXA7_9ALTE|nr:sulfite exporter TauE/SafE family protein [Alteromonas sp. ASW11-36]MDM7860829.1 sulfite exporter TauE/SafE family protein [Alteromonas sp. ASW11-36]